MTDGFKPAFGLASSNSALGLRPKSIGACVKRVEDPRLLTGQGMFTADRIIPGALHVAFRRSDHANALISSISTAAAAEMPGVFAVYTAQEMHDLVEPVRASSRLKDYHATELHPLARDKVRYVGEPVVAVLAENRYLAEDALARIEITYEPLETVMDPEMAGVCQYQGLAGTGSVVGRPGIGCFAVSSRRPGNLIPADLLRHQALQPVEKVERLAWAELVVDANYFSPPRAW
jgi:CO/xanthine dehydrogenase Mo-binding subunit